MTNVPQVINLTDTLILTRTTPAPVDALTLSGVAKDNVKEAVYQMTGGGRYSANQLSSLFQLVESVANDAYRAGVKARD